MKKALQRVYIGMDSDGSYYAIPYRRRDEFLNDQATGDDSFYHKWDSFICDLWKLELYTMTEEDSNQEETHENDFTQKAPANGEIELNGLFQIQSASMYKDLSGLDLKEETDENESPTTTETDTPKCCLEEGIPCRCKRTVQKWSVCLTTGEVKVNDVPLQPISMDVWIPVSKQYSENEPSGIESPEESHEPYRYGCGCMVQDICPYQKDVTNQTGFCTCCDFCSD